MYVAAVPVATDQDDNETLALERKGFRVVDFQNTPFVSLGEASKLPYPTADAAANVVFSLPKTKNIDYEVVEAQADEQLRA